MGWQARRRRLIRARRDLQRWHLHRHFGDMARGPGNDDFMEVTQSDGYTALGVRQNVVGGVIVVSFVDRWWNASVSQWYGVQAGEGVVTTCPDEQRIVGLTTRPVGGIGNIGSFGLLCAGVTGKC